MVNTSAGDYLEESDYTNNADSVEFTIDAPQAAPQTLVAVGGDGVVGLDWDPVPSDAGLRMPGPRLPERPAVAPKKLITSIPDYEVLLQKIEHNRQSNMSRNRTTGDACGYPFVVDALPYSNTGSDITAFSQDYPEGVVDWPYTMYGQDVVYSYTCLLYTSPRPRD